MIFNSVFPFPIQNQSQQCGNIIFHSFDPVVVRLSLDSTNIQHEKLTFQMVKPFIKDFSIEAASADAMETSQPSKRKSNENMNKIMKKKKN